MKTKILKFFAALILSPAVYFCFKEVGKAAWQIVPNYAHALYFLGGGALYLLTHFFVYDFSRPYVLAHELTHAAAALFFGYKVKSIKVNKRSGQVKLTDYNDAVVLAPYVLPLYFMLCAVAVFILIKNGFNGEIYQNIYAAALGFFFIFHITHTIATLTETSQPDLIMAGGRFYSILLIVLLNIFFLMLLTGIMFPQIFPLWQVLKNIFWDFIHFWQKVLNYMGTVVIEILEL